MTSVKNLTTGEVVELECVVCGIDILADVMGGSGVEHGGEHWAMEDDDVLWWTRWAEREERICSAYDEADDDTRRAYEEAIVRWGHDMEALQDEQERVLGIEG